MAHGYAELKKISKDAKISNQYIQVPHLTQDTNEKVTNLHLDTTNESKEVSPFPAVKHEAQINARKCIKNTDKKFIDPQKNYYPGMVSNNI